MNNSNIRHYWNGRCTLLLLAVAAVPILSLAWLSTDQPNRLAAAASLDGLVRGPSAVVATVCLYVAWRLSGQRQLAWLAASTATLAVQAVIMAGLQLATIDRAFNENLWMVPFDFLTMLVIGWLVTSAGQRSLLGDPVLIGLGAGLILGLGRLASIVLLPDLDPVWVSRPTAVLGFLAVVVPTVLLLWLLPDVPRWASSRLGAALFLYALAHLSAFLAGHPATVTGSLITLSSDLAGAVFLSAAAVAMLRLTIGVGNDDRDRLQLRVDELEAGLRQDRARIHEINSTIAGLASATRLLHEDHTIGAARRTLLQDMIHAELGRLQRLLNEPSARAEEARRTVPVEVARDATIGNLVLAHEARGTRVNWLPSGARGAGEPDQVAEVLNILLDNAAKHGRSDTSVTVQTVADAIEVAVADDGPGVSPEVRSHLFEWGARGPRSSGQGIGLHIAQDLTRRHGGHLTLRDDAAARGATFVARFPRARRDDDDSAHIA